MNNTRLVNLRVLAITMVVLGHSMVIYSSDWNLYSTENTSLFFDYFKKTIYVIALPLFFSLSGYLFNYAIKKKKGFKVLVKDKFYRILIPYISVSLVWLIPIKLLVQYPGYQDISLLKLIITKILLGKDNGHLWYLPTLFIIFIVMYFLCRCLYKKNNVIYNLGCFCILGCMFLLSLKMPLTVPYLVNVMKFIIWFYLGYLINEYEKILRSKRIYTVIVCIFSITIILLYITTGKNIIQYAAAFFSVIALYLVVPEKTSGILRLINKNSFGIYLLHSPLLYISFSQYPNINPFIMVFINFVIFGTVALGMTILIRFLKLFFIIGEK